jgi:hypothetical protein
MRTVRFVFAICSFAIASSAPGFGHRRGEASAEPSIAADDPIRTLVGRLDLEKCKATIKGLAQFGDRQQGTDRNRAAVDWIEAQLRSYGCSTERINAANPTGRRSRNATARPGDRRRNDGQRDDCQRGTP